MSFRQLVSGPQACGPASSSSSAPRTAANPLTRFAENALLDPMKTKQIAEGYSKGPVGASSMGPDVLVQPAPEGGRMGDYPPFPAAPMEAAWGGDPRLGGLGAAMDDRLAAHLASFGPQQHMEGPPQGPMPWDMAPPESATWTAEFVSRPASPHPPMVSSAPPMAHHAQSVIPPQMEMQGPSMMGAPWMGGGLMNPYWGESVMMPPSNFAMHRGMANFTARPPPAVAAVQPMVPTEVNALEAGAAKLEQDMKSEENPPPTEKFDRGRARQLADQLRQLGDPKMEASEFLKFVENFADGVIDFQDNQLVDGTGKPVDWDELYDADFQARNEQSKEDHNVARGTFEDSMRELEEAWQKAKENGEISEEEVRFFQSVFKNDGGEIAWNDFATPTMVSDRPAAYTFQEENPYMENDTANRIELAQRLLKEGRVREAILALEAEVQSNPESSEGWRLLGQLHADNEQDVEAIVCLRRGHEVDPYNLDSLLALGVSLTNELDSTQALRHLRTWLAHHEDFGSRLPELSNPIPTDYEELRLHVTDLFTKARDICRSGHCGIGTADLDVALGVMENINRNYTRATEHFANAIRATPPEDTATIWNKIGATLANSGLSESALLAYHQALSLRPNYPRAWANLGIAHANMDHLEDAVRFYLTALKLNPKADHLWHYVRTAMLHQGKYDGLQYVDDRNIDALATLYSGVADESSLPPPGQPAADTETTLLRILTLL